MLVKAIKSFFGEIDAKKGNTYDVDDKLAEAWIADGFVEEVKNSSTEKSPAPAPKAPVAPKETKTPETPKQPNAPVAPKGDDADGKKLDDLKDEKADTTIVKSDDLKTTEQVKTDKTETVTLPPAGTAPVEKTVSNTPKKGN